MKTAQQVLAAKGFDNDQIADILYHNQALDMKVREEFGVQDEPLHLWEYYYTGDADREVLAKIAKEKGFFIESKIETIDGDGDVDGMLIAMDNRLIELCEEINNGPSLEEKLNILVTLQNGHPDDINPLLNEYQSTQSRFSDYVDEYLKVEGEGRNSEDLTDDEVKAIAYNYVSDFWE